MAGMARGQREPNEVVMKRAIYVGPVATFRAWPPVGSIDIDVLTVADASQAVSLLRQHPIEALVFDARTPEQNAIELLEKFRRIAPDLPVLLLIAADDLQTGRRAIQGGAADFLREPFSTEELFLRLQRAIDLAALRLEHMRLVDVIRPEREKYAAGAGSSGEDPRALSNPHAQFTLHLENTQTLDFKLALTEFEQALLAWAYQKAGHNQGQAAKHLNIPRSTFQYRWHHLFKK